MRKQNNPKYKINAEINIIPFLDVLLVLLIIFMIMPSQLLIRQGFEVQLPTQDTVKNIIKDKKFLITIEILGAEIYNFTTNDQFASHIPFTQLISNINHAKINNPESICLIAASKEEKYSEIIKILNVLNKIGINSIGMITNPIQTK